MTITVLTRNAVALLLAIVLMSTVLTVAPAPPLVPLVGTEKAVAHEQQSCSWQPYTVSTRVRLNGEWSTQTVTRHRWVCVNVPHTHWWQSAARWAGTHLACAGFSASVGGATLYGTKNPSLAGAVTGTVQRGCTNFINQIG